MKIRIAIAVTAVCLLSIGIFFAYSSHSSRRYWKFAGPQFLVTDATTAQISSAALKAAAKLCFTAAPNQPLPITSRSSTSKGSDYEIWQSAVAFLSKAEQPVRIEAIGRTGVETIVYFEVGNTNETLSMLNAFIAELEAQGIHRLP